MKERSGEAKTSRSGSAGGGENPWVILVDVGNTNAVFGVYQGEELVCSFRLSTTLERTADEYLSLLSPLFEHAEIDPGAARAVVISSVVPPLHFTLERLSERLFGCRPHFIDGSTDTGLELDYDHPTEIGADRIVNALAARELYGSPVVVVDFGTATTFDVVDRLGRYIGGLITPGLQISSEALFSRASRLYRVEIVKPKELVGTNTGAAMQAGLYYGYLGQIDGILERLIREMDGSPKIVATGGLASLLAGGSRYLEKVDQMLTLSGLRLIYERNRRQWA